MNHFPCWKGECIGMNLIIEGGDEDVDLYLHPCKCM